MNTDHQKKMKSCELKRYLKEIRRLVPDAYTDKAKVINSIKQNIAYYLCEFPNASFEDVLREFGTPAEVAAAFLEELPDAVITRSFRAKNAAFLFLSVISIAVITLLMGRIYYMQKHIIVTVENTVIQEEPNAGE